MFTQTLLVIPFSTLCSFPLQGSRGIPSPPGWGSHRPKGLLEEGPAPHVQTSPQIHVRVTRSLW